MHACNASGLGGSLHCYFTFSANAFSDNATSTDDDDTYGVIAPTANGTSSENKSTVTVKNGSAKSSRADEVSSYVGSRKTGT